MAQNIGPMLNATPPDVSTMAGILFVLVAATAAGDIATDRLACSESTVGRTGPLKGDRISIGQVLVIYEVLGIPRTNSMRTILHVEYCN